MHRVKSVGNTYNVSPSLQVGSTASNTDHDVMVYNVPADQGLCSWIWLKIINGSSRQARFSGGT